MAVMLQHAAILAAALLVPAAAADEGLPAVGATRDGELGAGGVQAFSVEMSTAQVLEVTVEQRGVDVALVFLAPSGATLAFVDGPIGTTSREELFAVTAESGTHRLELRAPANMAGTGRYVLTVKSLREASPADLIRGKAEQHSANADRLVKADTAQSLAEALPTYREALALFQEIGDRRGEGAVQRAIGFLQYNLGNYPAARDATRAGLEAARETGDRQAQSTSLLNLMAILRLMGEVHEALQYGLEALELKRALGDRGGEAVLLNNLAVNQGELGNRQAALEFLNQALVLRREVGDRVGEGATLGNLGALYGQLGESRDAITHLESAIALQRQQNDSRTLGRTLLYLADVESKGGEQTKALAHLREALEIALKTGSRDLEARTRLTLADIHVRMGEQDKALEHYQKALELRKASGDQRGEARSWVGIGSARVDRGEWDLAREALNAALALQRRLGDAEGEARALVTLARLEQRRGDLDAARVAVEQAVERAEALRQNIASLALRASYFATHRDAFELDVEILMQLDAARPGQGFAAQALAASERGRARTLLELLAEAPQIRSGVDPALAHEELTLRQRLSSKGQRRMLLAAKDEAATAAMDREIQELVRALERVEAQITAGSPRYAALTQPRPLGAAEIEALLDPDTLLIAYVLGEDASVVWCVGGGSIVARRLPKGAAVKAAARAVYELVATPPAAGAAGSLGASAGPLRTLSDMILGPIADRLGARRIVVISDGALHYVPFAALPVPGRDQPLIAEHEIVNLPSASVLATLRQERAGHSAPRKTLFVMGDPVFSADDERVRHGRVASRGAAAAAAAEPRVTRALRSAGVSDAVPARLPFTRREAKAILALVPSAQREQALDFDASRAGLMDAHVGDFRLVHLATHGLLNSDQPELSGIVLSLVRPDGTRQDGFLSASEIFNLRLGADLVVLSGCRTGLGREIKGEGLVGLVRAFMYAGASRVMASLWRVDDAGTAELMKRFYERLLGPDRDRPAAALREAQLTLLRSGRWSAPYYWAAFTLQGDWK